MEPASVSPAWIRASLRSRVTGCSRMRNDDYGLKSGGRRRSCRRSRRRARRRRAKRGARDGDFDDRFIAADDHFLIGEGNIVLGGRAVEEGGLGIVRLREEDG